MNTGRISKSRQTERFTTIPNAMLRDKGLSAKAKGILCFLLSLPSDWVIYKSTLHTNFSDGIDSIRSGWAELEQSGYVKSVRCFSESGLFGGWNYEISDSPEFTPEKPITGKPILDFPISENPTLLNTNNTTNNVNTTKEVFSLIEGSIVPIMEKEESFSELDNNQKQSAMYVVQEMVKVYQKKNPDYFFDKETDYHACLQIVYKIAKMKNWGKMEALEGKMRECLASWDKISDFISNDKWLSTRSLSDISTVKEWQRLVNGMNAEKKSKPKISDYEKNRQEQLEKYRNKTTVPQ